MRVHLPSLLAVFGVWVFPGAAWAEPSEGEMREAVQHRLDSSGEMIRGVLETCSSPQCQACRNGDEPCPTAAQIVTFEKLGCEPAAPRGFVCSYRCSVQMEGMERRSELGVGRARFAREGSRWVMTKRPN